MLNFIDFLDKNPLKEGKTAKDWIYRLKSILSGNTRRQRIGREFAAFDQPLEKSVGLKPRQQKSPASKTNVSLLTQEFEHNALNEAYD